jgi:hypothetical protein
MATTFTSAGVEKGESSGTLATWFGYDTTGLVSIDSVGVVVAIDTAVKTSGGVFTLSSGELTIAKTATFMVDWNITPEETASARNSVDTWLEIDTGVGFAKVTGSDSRSGLRTTSEFPGSTASGFWLLDVTSGDKIRLVVKRFYSTTAMRTLPDASRLRVIEVNI